MRRPFPASRLIAAFFSLFSSSAPVAHAAGINGMPLCTVAGDQVLPVTVSDGVGGMIVIWLDNRGSSVVYGQRVSAAGVPLWAPNGLQLSTTADQNPPVAVADGAGGVFFAFGGASAPPRAQRVNASGVRQWGVDGVALTSASGTRELAIAADIGGTGGAFVAWRLDNGASGLPDVYAQKLNSTGTQQWGPQGVPVTNTSMNSEGNPAVVSNAVGGAIVVWTGSSGVRAQAFNSAGSSLWGNVILASLGNNMAPSIVADGASGAVVAWAGGGAASIQRVIPDGSRIWGAPNGGVVLSATGRAPKLIADGGGGAIVTWEDNRTANFNIYAQKMNSLGAPQWTPDGAPVCIESADQRAPQIVTDASGGAIICWFDGRSGGTGLDIYAQRINGASAPQWVPNGVAISTAPNDQESPTMAIDGNGGAWIAWEDLRSGTNEDVYAAHRNGAGGPLAVPGAANGAVVRAWPHPFTDRVAMEFVLPAAANVRTRVYDLGGRVVADLGSATLSEGRNQVTWNGRATDGGLVGGGVFFIRVESPGLALSQSVVRLK
jgi:hypothetical protein